MKKELTEVQRAYLAGFFDADGSIQSYRRGNWRVRISISQKYRPVLDLLHSWLGIGYVQEHGTKACFSYRCGSRKDVLRIIRLMLPYAQNKAEQLKVGLELAELVQNSTGGVAITDEKKEEREKLALRLKELKHEIPNLDSGGSK